MWCFSDKWITNLLLSCKILLRSTLNCPWVSKRNTLFLKKETEGSALNCWYPVTRFSGGRFCLTLQPRGRSAPAPGLSSYCPLHYIRPFIDVLLDKPGGSVVTHSPFLFFPAPTSGISSLSSPPTRLASTTFMVIPFVKGIPARCSQ